jgi:predicted MPP superfamily phosphohydrolase
MDKTSRRNELRVWAVAAIAFLQGFLFWAHWFLYRSVVAYWPPSLQLSPEVRFYLRGTLLVLSGTFLMASLLGHWFANGAVGLLYRLSSVWMGMLNFLFWAACACRLMDLVLKVAPSGVSNSVRPWIGTTLFGSAILISVYGFVNARMIRVHRFTVTLSRLPDAWKGRTALLVSDLHLGHINSVGFARRIAGIARRLNPSTVFIAGDLYDGSKVDPASLAAPLFELSPPYGIYFSGGNHEDFGDAKAYTAAIQGGGIRVLHNERVVLDGLQVIGVSYADSTLPAHLRGFLESLHLAEGPASILLNHVPHGLPIVEQTGVSLQLSGHTHGGQMFPFTLIVRRAYGKFSYGLQRFGNLQVLTSSGAGTWGPPMRVGTRPEVVLITFA